MIPENYASWRHCIEVDCRQPLTAAFISERMTELSDTKNERTQQFIRRYGAHHYESVLAWFAQAQQSA